MPEIRLYYVHDPMCSWCYAFTESLAALQQDLPSNLQMTYLLGGLAPDSTEPMSENMQNTIQQVWRRIENTVPGIRFNFDFWTQNTPLRSTYPACRALLAARKQGADFELRLLSSIQKAYYQQASTPSLQSILVQCAADVGLDNTNFIKDLASVEIDDQLQGEINYARSLGVTSYPSLCLMLNGQPIAINIDYLNHHTMLDQISAILL